MAAAIGAIRVVGYRGITDVPSIIAYYRRFHPNKPLPDPEPVIFVFSDYASKLRPQTRDHNEQSENK